MFLISVFHYCLPTTTTSTGNISLTTKYHNVLVNQQKYQNQLDFIQPTDLIDGLKKSTNKDSILK